MDWDCEAITGEGGGEREAGEESRCENASGGDCGDEIDCARGGDVARFARCGEERIAWWVGGLFRWVGETGGRGEAGVYNKN